MSDDVKGDITNEMKRHCLEHSTERRVSKDFPEYHKFITGKVEFRKIRIINVGPLRILMLLKRLKKGGLGDLIETYVNLWEEKLLWRRIRTYLFGLNKGIQ
jgi:hypothetical protein